MDDAIFRWRFSGILSEDAVELRKRLKSDRESDFADSKIDILQQLSRFFESGPGDVIDKLHAGYLFEFFAEMSRINARDSRDFFERQVFVEMFIDIFPRAPNIARLGAL